MKVLLDTHVWLWYLTDDRRLTKRQRTIIEDSESDLYLSPISIWETALLIEQRRLPVNEPAQRWIEMARQQLPVREAPLTFAMALRSRTLELAQQDPADRFIAATSLEMRAPLVTSDRHLIDCAELTCIS